MSKTWTRGPFRYAARSWANLSRAAVSTFAARALNGPLAPGWSADFEIGVRFWRAQFARAMGMSDPVEARRYFDSLQTWTDEVYDVVRAPSEPGAPRGDWVTPPAANSDITLLYLHGGGYMFASAITHRFADMLAHHLGTRLFAPNYRLTPEHRHPAQREDALSAYRYLLNVGVDPAKLVVIGDSAGGHLALMTLVALGEAGLPQPALAVGLCPWTDIGARGASLRGNDRYDVVQGWMALRFGDLLVGDTGVTREAVSPIHQDFRGLAPLYLQAGANEVLVDMIRDFARAVADRGCEVTLDVWPGMVHDFQAHGRTRTESAEALARIGQAIEWYAGDDPRERSFPACSVSEVKARPPEPAVQASQV